MLGKTSYNWDPTAQRHETESSKLTWKTLALGSATVLSVATLWISWRPLGTSNTNFDSTFSKAAVLQECDRLQMKAGAPAEFVSRKESDRFVPGTSAYLLKNATVWTGGKDGEQILHETDVFLDNGIIKEIVPTSSRRFDSLKKEIRIIDLNGSWITPGLIDMHSHIGVFPSPTTMGTFDMNSWSGPVLPGLRSIDAMNTHDALYNLSIAGGVTTVLILPGSANAIGGQAYTIKLRATRERSPSSKLLSPPFYPNGSAFEEGGKLRWRHLKQACGENPTSNYGGSRMDTYWAFREAYEEARKLKRAQDNYCLKAQKGLWKGLGEFPESLKWQSLVDVLRGRTKVHTHCYSAVDFDAIVRLSNEFEFPLAAFHHAHEAYLVPDLLKKSYGEPPAIAMFATSARYKHEAYWGSEFAPKILADAGIKVVLKSDVPAVNSRYLAYEAQQAHYYGLPTTLALASITTVPAQTLGLDHRVGYIREGYDADLVVWDSHPLALGATPKQVFIDGITQYPVAFVSEKSAEAQAPPKVPSFDHEANDALDYNGMPPLNGQTFPNVLFTNVKSIWTGSGYQDLQESVGTNETLGQVLVDSGVITCVAIDCIIPRPPIPGLPPAPVIKVVDLEGGSLNPGLVAYGADIGLQEIEGERTTNDGPVFDPMVGRVPGIAGGEGYLPRAVDGLQFGGRDSLLAYRSGVTRAITAPAHEGFLAGLSTYFSVGASHRFEKGAVLEDIVAVHVALGHYGRMPYDTKSSISTQIGSLRYLLTGNGVGEIGKCFSRVLWGENTLVVEVDNADNIGALLALKSEIESISMTKMKFTISGGTEAHLLAEQIAEAGVGVIVRPSRPFPITWDKRRILPGPPLSEESALVALKKANVTVGIGVAELWATRHIRFDAGWAALESSGRITQTEALLMASTNLEKLLGVPDYEVSNDLVATKGGTILDFSGKVVGVISSRRKMVELF
ncbi:carbohydrate esterase family 9 protein [Sistotremastrum niveocremeum HHB9708]|uniref:Carbohydrate esterase family 9 protein n=1 Tax=Sistotremastrum niveocremeum HHB9708 TaxID=1314777 RepID=A0A164TTW9_9AGAM|nr:carbohydrate esterase family 9 protein [Sistotremastrum niveocremeum HHB9708]